MDEIRVLRWELGMIYLSGHGDFKGFYLKMKSDALKNWNMAEDTGELRGVTLAMVVIVLMSHSQMIPF